MFFTFPPRIPFIHTIMNITPCGLHTSVPCGHRTLYHHRRIVAYSKKPSENPTPAEETNVGLDLKSVWFGAEAFGNLLAAFRGATNAPTNVRTHASRITRSEALEAIRADYDAKYFVSGAGDLSAYSPMCRFADPFAAFKSTDRFKRNVSNLGGMLRDVQLDIIEWEEGENSLSTKWRFAAILDLPWRPRLAAAGGTVHVFDPESGLVVEHIESWDVEPGKVLRSLLKPSSKVPTNNWEVLLNALNEGDPKGVWLASSGNVAKLSAGLLFVSVIATVVNGEGLPVWPVAACSLVAALVTEVLKFSGGLQGGETGTGGRF